MLADLRHAIRTTPDLARLRLARLSLLARAGRAHQDLSGLIASDVGAWRAAQAAARAGRRVLLATNMGGHFGLAAIDRLLAVALTLRGANVATVLCDSALPACQMCEINLVPDVERFASSGPPGVLCNYCSRSAARAAAPLGLALLSLGRYVTARDRETAREFANSLPFEGLATSTWAGLPVGEHAVAGALRYFARGSLAGEPAAEGVLRRFCAATVVAAGAYERLLDEVEPEVVVAHHGIYVPQGIVAAVARKRGARVVTWNPAYRRKCFIFSHDDTYHRTLMEEPAEAWQTAPLTSEQQARIESYLESRRRGDQDWISFHRAGNGRGAGDLASLAAGERPLVVAYTNVFWDAQLHYASNAFADQREWLIDTVGWFAQRPDLQLVVRVHPAEVTGSPPSRQLAAAEIAQAFPTPPANVRIVGPDSPVSSYALAERADTAILYASKLGVELSAVGIPVIVAGEAWVRGKGITTDVASKAHYRELLAALPARRRLDPAHRQRALAYAHHFFFRRMIPIACVEPARGPRRFTIAARRLSDLTRGSDAGLDVVCEGILDGTQFHYQT
jgi:hypothetical protein